MFRRIAEGLEVLIVHPGGPFFAKKDVGAWSIPKGKTAEGEDLMETARREFREELGVEAHGEMIPLGDARPHATVKTAAARYKTLCHSMVSAGL